MKRIQALLIGITIIFTGLHTAAQEGEPVLASVIYEFRYVNDTTHRDQPVTEKMILRLGQNSSRYSSYTLESNLRKQSNGRWTEMSGGAIKRGGGGGVAIAFGPGVTEESLFQHIKENKLNKIAAAGGIDYLVEAPLPKIDWKITKETRKIDAYSCQKAVGNYAGRSYTAWFTTDLPFRNGPWKLSGLPGLILEATDAKNEVSFLFKEISRDSTSDNTGTTIKKLVQADEKEFDRVYQAYQTDPIGTRRSQMPGATGPIDLILMDSTGKSSANENALPIFEKYKKETNNPIELIKQ